MHRLLGTTWIPYTTLVTAVWIYGIALPITASAPSDRGRQVAASVCIWVFSVAYMILFERWFWYALQQKRRLGTKLTRAFFDILFAHYHVVAALGFSIWLMDTSANKDTFFTGIAPASSGDVYGVYVGDFLKYSVLVINSAGASSVTTKPSSWLPALWAMFTSISGVLLLVFLLSLLLQHMTMDRVTEPSLEQKPSAAQATMPKFTSNFNLRQRPRIYSTK